MAYTVNATSAPRSSRAIVNLSPPWSHVVRGEQEPSAAGGGGGDAPSSPLASTITSPELPGRSPRKQSADNTQLLLFSGVPVHGGDGYAADAPSTNRGKRPVWNVPSNGSIEVGSMMDTMSWPALSEAARSSPKSSSSDSLPVLSDGFLYAELRFGASFPSSKQGSSNQIPNSVQSFQSSARHKTMTRGASNGGQAMPTPMTITTEANQSVADKKPSPVPSPQGLPNRNHSNKNSWDHGAKDGGSSLQTHDGNDHQRGYDGGRKESNGHHNNRRRDPERGGFEWSHRNFNRDAHMQPPHQQRGVRTYLRPSPVATAPFITPPPISPFANHMGFPDFQHQFYYVAASPHPEPLRAMPFPLHPAPAPQMMVFPAFDPHRAMLLKQIDYYFSEDNLIKDLFLRENMDEQGWVPLSLIANFNRVKKLTDSTRYILDTVQLSSVVELQGDRIRKRDDWISWLLPSANPVGSAPTIQSPTTAAYDGLAAQVSNVVLKDSLNSNQIKQPPLICESNYHSRSDFDHKKSDPKCHDVRFILKDFY